MTPPWTAECVVSAELAAALIDRQFPHLAPARLEPLGAGFDNTAYRVNEVYVFRFPRRQMAVALLEAETQLLPALAPRLPVPVPVPAFVGRPTDAYPWPFAGYRLLPGRTACSAALDEQDRICAAVPLGRFLAALHAVPADEAHRLGADPDTLARLDLARRIPRSRELLNDLARSGALTETQPFAAILESAPSEYVPRADTLVHGDLYARHLLVDAEKSLAGVIDWGDVHVGDPAVDLAAALTFLPPTARPAFVAAYGPIAEITWIIARCRAVWHTLIVLAYAHGIAAADLMREAHVSLRHLPVTSH